MMLIGIDAVALVGIAFGLLMALSDAFHMGISVLVLTVAVFARYEMTGNIGGWIALLAAFTGFVLGFYHHYIEKVDGQPAMARADLWLFIFFSYWLGAPIAAVTAYAVLVFIAKQRDVKWIPMATYYYVAYLVVLITNAALAGMLVDAGHAEVFKSVWYRLIFYTPQSL